MGYRALSAGIWALGAFAQAAQAQTAPVTPGVVGDSLKPPPELTPPSTTTVPAPPRETPPPPPAGRSIEVSRFEFSGNTVFSSAELEKLVAGYLGRPLSLLQIYEAADKVADFYVARGYTLASVTVPAQKVSEGSIKLEVIEGRVGQVQVEGAKRYRQSNLAYYLNKVSPGAVYRGAELEDGLATLNELPGLTARATLKPGAEYGSTDVVVQAQEKTLAGSLTVDNFGRKNIGRIRSTGNLVINNPTRAEDQLSFTALVSEDALLRYGAVNYSLPVTAGGTRLELSYGQAEFDVDGTTFDGVGGDNRNSRAALNVPLLRTRTDRLLGSVAVSSTRSNADLFGNTFADTRLNLLELGAQYSHSYSNLAVSQLIAGISSNFKRATVDSLFEPEGKDGQRFRAELDAQHLQPLWRRLSLLVHINGVYSPDPLADTQQFSLGGPGSVRGFAASEVRGDRGWLGAATLRQSFGFGAVQLAGRAFADAGQAFVEEAPPGSPKRRSLSSVGLGLDAQYKGLAAHVDASLPQKGAPDEDDGARVFAAISVSF